MSRAIISARRSTATIVPSTLRTLRVFGVEFEATGTLAATAFATVYSAAEWLASATLAAVAVLDHTTAAAMNATAQLSALAVQDSYASAALAGSGTLAAATVQDEFATAALAAIGALTVSSSNIEKPLTADSGATFTNESAVDFHLDTRN